MADWPDLDPHKGCFNLLFVYVMNKFFRKLLLVNFVIFVECNFVIVTLGF
jgi:hypothetical protein